MSNFNFRSPEEKKPRKKEAEMKPRETKEEFVKKFQAFAARKRMYREAAELDDDGVDIDTEIPEDIAKEISQEMA